ncbi:MAG: hypothetical protein E7004_03430 [Alphaproteobacteria bacterium]|nr:hypothetical protein [Alphaproteobacteria bacterium]
MVDFQKYLFDNFVVKNDKATDVVSEDNQPLETDEEIVEVYDTVEDIETTEEIVEENIEEVVEEVIEEKIEEVAEIETQQPIIEPSSYNFAEEKIDENMAVYTEEEYQQAIEEASKNAYDKAMEDAKNSSFEQQNILLENIKNQLMTIYSTLDEKQTTLEASALNFSIEMVRKILPTLEKERAEKEVKNFLAENFANFSNQDTLSFSFNPEIISSVADSISRLAEQNDFAGKISVHKDISLGLSDCRVEWKSGGVERKTSDLINKVENLVNTNNQERENG